MDKELKASAGAFLRTIYILHFSICEGCGTYSFKAPVKAFGCFWRYLAVVLGGKNIK